MGRVFVALQRLAGSRIDALALRQQDESAARCQGLRPLAFRWGEFGIAREVNGAAIIARDGRAQLREIGRLAVVLAFLTQLPMPGLPQGVDQPSLVTQYGGRGRPRAATARCRRRGREAVAASRPAGARAPAVTASRDAYRRGARPTRARAKKKGPTEEKKGVGRGARAPG